MVLEQDSLVMVQGRKVASGLGTGRDPIVAGMGQSGGTTPQRT